MENKSQQCGLLLIGSKFKYSFGIYLNDDYLIYFLSTL
jgi:hypothetical protein